MLIIKSYDDKKVTFVDENNKEYELKCKNDNESFDIDVLEDILDWEYRVEKKEGSK